MRGRNRPLTGRASPGSARAGKPAGPGGVATAAAEPRASPGKPSPGKPTSRLVAVVAN